MSPHESRQDTSCLDLGICVWLGVGEQEGQGVSLAPLSPSGTPSTVRGMEMLGGKGPRPASS